MRTVSVFLLLLAAAFAFQKYSYAETLIECRASSGWVYFAAGGLVPVDEAGWEKDRISDGAIVLTNGPDGEFDLLFKDIVVMKSVSSYGAKIFVLGVGEKTVSVLARYSGAVSEFYSFDLKNRYVYWSQHKLEQQINKAGTFIAKCN